MPYRYEREVDIKELIGKTLVSHFYHDDELHLSFADGSRYRMSHAQDCCEYVSLEEIHGDLNDLIGTEILQAEKVESREEPAPKDRGCESYTWTFYKIRSVKADVTLRWFGDSNGYYSETVDLYRDN